MKKFKNSELSKSIKVIGGWKRSVSKIDTDGDGRWDQKTVIWTHRGSIRRHSVKFR